MYSARNVRAQNCFQVLDVGPGINHCLELVKKSAGVQLDGAEYFEGIALAGGWDFWLETYLGSGLIQGGILAEGGLVSKEDGGAFAVGCFF